MKSARDNRGGFAGFQFQLDSRNPFYVTIINEARRNRGRFFPQMCVACPQRVGIALPPRFVHPARFLVDVIRLASASSRSWTFSGHVIIIVNILTKRLFRRDDAVTRVKERPGFSTSTRDACATLIRAVGSTRARLWGLIELLILFLKS